MIDRTAPEWADSIADYQKAKGLTLPERCKPYVDYVNARRDCGTWWVGRVLTSGTGANAGIADEYGDRPAPMVNFGSQDYLGLASHPGVRAAAQSAVDKWGVHSAGSPALIGRTSLLLNVEDRLSELLSKESTTLFPTGWAAGFGVITALVQPSDYIVIDRLAHNCLQNGARHATRNILTFRHNDVEHLEERLSEIRATNQTAGIFLITESLFSMDSDSPDLTRMMQLASQYRAITILDVAHDFGALGDSGLGFVEEVPPELRPDVIMGSFSKTFAANGGFVSSASSVKDYMALQAHSLTFSNAMSPMQTAVIHECLRIIFSGEGARLRGRLMENVLMMRNGMEERGLEVGGVPSAIVPVFVGQEGVARLTYTTLMERGLQANLVEFPGVARGRARFRFQLMATHDARDIMWACDAMADAKASAEAKWRRAA